MCLPLFITQALLAEGLRPRIRKAPGADSHDELFDAVDGSGFSAEPWKARKTNEDDGQWQSLTDAREKHRPTELLPRVVYDVLSAQDIAKRALFDKHVRGKTQEELDAKYGPGGKKKK